MCERCEGLPNFNTNDPHLLRIRHDLRGIPLPLPADLVGTYQTTLLACILADFESLTRSYVSGGMEFSDYRDQMCELIQSVGVNRFKMNEVADEM